MDRRGFLSLALLGVASPRSALSLLAGPRYRSRPDLDPPRVHVISAPRQTAPGYVFVANAFGEGQAGPMILDDDGELVWFTPRDGVTVMNFGRHTLAGSQVLAWWEGGGVTTGHGSGEFVLLGPDYRELTRVRAGNGLTTDFHEFSITPQGSAILTAYASSADGSLLDSVVQEVDIASGAVLLEWRASDHVAVGDSYATRGSGPFDFAHLNAAALDSDGNVLVSSRHTWTIYKVDRATGETIWRLGGKRSDFALDTAAQFSWQHHVRRHRDETLTVFDNGAGVFDSEAYSRGLRFALDETAGTATLVQQVSHPDRLLASAMGSMEPLEDGGAFVGWGSVARFSEFAADGTIRFDAGYPAGGFTYRAFRRSWVAAPVDSPALAIAQGAAWASWNGATSVARWRLLAGATRAALQPVGAVARRSFETELRLPRGARWARVDALDARGKVVGRSRPVRV